MNERGGFIDGGYIMPDNGTFREYYTGRDDLPDEHKIFAYPDPPGKMPMREQLAMYGKMALSQPAGERPDPAREER